MHTYAISDAYIRSYRFTKGDQPGSTLAEGRVCMGSGMRPSQGPGPAHHSFEIPPFMPTVVDAERPLSRDNIRGTGVFLGS